MAAFKTGFRLVMGVVLIAYGVHGNAVFAADSRFGLLPMLVADAGDGKVTEPEVKPEESEKTNANTNILKETFKKLVGKDDGKKEEPAPVDNTEKTVATEKAASKTEAPAAEGEEKPKEGMIKKALNQLINKKNEEDAKEEVEAAKEKTATLTDTVKDKKAEGEAKVESSEEKTNATAKKFISDTIDKIVETVKGDDKKEGEESNEQAKVESQSKPKPEPEAVTPPQPEKEKVESELAAKENEVPEDAKKNSNPLKEAFEKLVGKKTDAKEEEQAAAPEKK